MRRPSIAVWPGPVARTTTAPLNRYGSRSSIWLLVDVPVATPSALLIVAAF
jgi:hypothetical protein